MFFSRKFVELGFFHAVVVKSWMVSDSRINKTERTDWLK